MIDELYEELIGKNLDYLVKNIDKYTDWQDKDVILKTYYDRKYKSKHKFVYDVPNTVNNFRVAREDLYIKFAPINIPEGTKKMFFSMTYKDDIIIGQGMFAFIYQLKSDFCDNMNDMFSYETLEDYAVDMYRIHIDRTFGDDLKKIEVEIDIHKETTQLLLVLLPRFSIMSLLIGSAPELSTQPLRYYYNDLFSVSPYIMVFQPLPGESGYGSVWLEKFEARRLTYFISGEVPNLPVDLDGYDFSNVWLCERDIYDDAENLLYEKDGVYALKTSVNYGRGDVEGSVEIIGWEKIDITKEQIDGGYNHYFFSGWNKIISQLLYLSQWEPGETFKGKFEFGDIMFSTINYEWAPAEGENAVDTEFKFNNKGVYIENNEEGFRREISASKDISTNLQTGENTWFLTPQGQWVKLLEAKEIRMGNFHIVEEDDEINFYYRGGN